MHLRVALPELGIIIIYEDAAYNRVDTNDRRRVMSEYKEGE